jgi:23S rRNA (cytosine1962-C5)-methyltransferase
MAKEVNLTIKTEYVQDYKNAYPLVLKDVCVNFEVLSSEGNILILQDVKKNFIAKAYSGMQNKGHGWVLTQDINEEINIDFFYKKIKEALKYREDFYKDNYTTAFRVFNGEGDGVGGLSIDYYDDYYVFTWYSKGIYSFKNDILEAFKKSAKYKGIYEKKRFNTKGMYLDSQSDFIAGVESPKPLIVKENGVNFAVYLDDGAMVGVFLDQKDVRKTLRDIYAKNKTLLNTFSYTGAFSIFGVVGGAIKTTSVDLAKRSLTKTSEQFKINNIDSKEQDIIVEDVFNYFKFAVRKKLLFDIVVLDPPSFARSKKHTFSASKDYVKLLKEAIQITNKGGLIVASTNSANFSMMRFRDFIKQAFYELNEKFKVLESFTLPKDFKVNPHFKEGNYLKVVFIKKI